MSHVKKTTNLRPSAVTNKIKHHQATRTHFERLNINNNNNNNIIYYAWHKFNNVGPEIQSIIS